jgi:CheY-like chemotaxis protein
VTTPDAGPAADPRVAPVLRVLIVEDDEDDATLLVAQLASAGRSISHRRVDTAARMREALIAAEWDIVISDHVMPGFSFFGCAAGPAAERAQHPVHHLFGLHQ